MFRPVRRLFARVLDPSHPVRAARCPAGRRARLLLQPLEGRVVPATFTVATAPASGPAAFGVTLSGLTVTGGQGQRVGLFTAGGGILATGPQSLTLVDVAVTGNTAGTGTGGGVATAGGALVLRNSTVTGNTAGTG